MIKIVVKKSITGKDDNFEKLKAEVIAILEKKDKQDFKKAIEYFEQDEKRYSHLEKSLDGKWIEKAGYGVGTVRIWKGKKYKKVSSSPVRWVRVFDKENRGAKSSMTRLINKVRNECDTPEKLYQFCLSHHALFQDDNGVDLPIMDKLRAAIDEQKGKVGDELDGSKHFQYNDKENKPAEKKESENKTKDFDVDSIKGQEGPVAMFKNQMETWNKDKLTDYYNEKLDKIKNAKVSGAAIQNVKNQFVAAKELLNEKFGETEAEKHQNRSDAMKGNKNAWKGLSKEEQNKKKSDYTIELVDKTDRYTSKDYENLKQQVLDGKTGLIGGGDDIPKEERADIISKLIESMKKDENTTGKKEKPTITFDRNGKLGEKGINKKLSSDNVKAFNSLAEKFADEKRVILQLPSEVEIDGEKKLAYTNGKFLVIANDISPDVKTNQSEKREGSYPNVARVIPKDFMDNLAPKVDIDIDQVMKDLPKVDFSKKAFNDDSKKQFMKIGTYWYDAKQIKAVYDMLQGDNAEVLESKDTFSQGRYGRLCIKTDKGYSVIVSCSNDYSDNHAKQSIYDSDKGSMSANEKADYESKKRTGLPDTFVNNAIEFGFKVDNKGFLHGEDKNISFKGKGDNTEFYYNGIPTGIKFRSSYMYGTKDNIQSRIDQAKAKIEERIESYKEGKKNQATRPLNYDTSFPQFTNEQLTDLYKWWNNPKNIEEVVYKDSYKTKVPGLGSYGNDARRIGAVEEQVMKMLPDIKAEIARRGITVKNQLMVN